MYNAYVTVKYNTVHKLTHQNHHNQNQRLGPIALNTKNSCGLLHSWQRFRGKHDIIHQVHRFSTLKHIVSLSTGTGQDFHPGGGERGFFVVMAKVLYFCYYSIASL